MTVQFLGFAPVDEAAADELRAQVSTTPQPGERMVAEYLRNGYVVLDVMEKTPDILDGSAVAASGSLLTDGQWLWRADLAHYVEKYHLPLPLLFLAHVQEANFSVPELSDSLLEALMPAILESWAMGPPSPAGTPEDR